MRASRAALAAFRASMACRPRSCAAWLATSSVSAASVTSANAGLGVAKFGLPVICATTLRENSISDGILLSANATEVLMGLLFSFILFHYF